MLIKEIKRFVNTRIFQDLFGLVVIPEKELERLRAIDRNHLKAEIPFFEYERLKFSDTRSHLSFFKEEEYKNIKKLKDLSKSQLWQDLFVLYFTRFKKGGFFVEFGAADGVSLSNTYLLEKEFGWKGILAEPAISWRKDLIDNRDVAISNKCVWKKSGESLPFLETEIGELSTIETFSELDNHAQFREIGKTYQVDTISLQDLLTEFSAPREMDYLSIDTEGSEYEVLNAFDFDKYRFNIITCEHNQTQNRDRIHKLLTQNNYERVYPQLTVFEDWYVYKPYLENFKQDLN